MIKNTVKFRADRSFFKLDKSKVRTIVGQTNKINIAVCIVIL